MRFKEDHKKYYEYETKDYIGKGGFATVYKAKLKEANENEQNRAIKIFNLFQTKIDNEGNDEFIQFYINSFHKEIEYMKTLEGEKKDNKNTVKLYEYFENDDELVIVMELCDTNLEKFLNKKNRFDINEIYYILNQLNNSFKIMAEKNIVHRDLSLKNILIKFENEEKTKYTVKLCDYGITKNLINRTKKTTFFQAGTDDFIAPEITKDQKFSMNSDLWSLGILIFYLYFNKKPFMADNRGAILNQVNQPIFRTKLKNHLKEAKDSDFSDLVFGLLVVDPKKRLTWDQYFNHPFFTKRQTHNQILIKIKIGKEDISKKIYFLDNEYYLQNNVEIKFDDFNKELKELLNNQQIEIYINGQIKNEKNNYFIPDKEGEYEIKLIFKKKIKDCSYMFRNCENIIRLDLSSFDSSDVNNMHYMFGKCHNLQEVVLSNLVADNITDMSYMFNRCFSLEKVVFPPSFNTSNVKKMESMFTFCQNLTEIHFSDNFKTNNVKSMSGMFKNCYKLKEIDLRNFTTQNLLDMGNMFEGCVNLEKILISKEFRTSLVSIMSYLFYSCINLKEINNGSKNLNEIDLSFFNTENVKLFDHMFSGCSQLKNLDLKSFKVKEPVNLAYMFDNCSNLESLNISNFEIRNDSENINDMFNNLTNIKEIKVNHDCLDIYKELFADIKEKFC